MPITVKTAAEGSLSELAQVAPASFLSEIIQTTAPEGEEMTAGFYKQVEGEVLEFTYPFDEFKYLIEVEGEFLITDENNTYSVKAGDTVYISKGSSLKFEAKGGYAKAFYVAKKAFGPPK